MRPPTDGSLHLRGMRPAEGSAAKAGKGRRGSRRHRQGTVRRPAPAAKPCSVQERTALLSRMPFPSRRPRAFDGIGLEPLDCPRTQPPVWFDRVGVAAAAERSLDALGALGCWPDPRRAETVNSLATGRGSRASCGPHVETFLEWFHAYRSWIRSAVIWGSYAAATESPISVNRDKRYPGGQGRLVSGPSDVDALIVTSAPLPRPFFRAPYCALDRDLRPAGLIFLDIFRDVFIIEERSLDVWLHTRSTTHLSWQLHALHGGGVLLKSDAGVLRKFESILAMRSSVAAPETYFQEKLNWRRALIARGRL